MPNRPKYPGWRTMTGPERYNARMHRMFEQARQWEAIPNEGQDRESYSDTQDRDCYSTEED